MHEVHLVREIIDAVVWQATSRGARRVKLVKVLFNRLARHSVGHVRMSFDIAKNERPITREALLVLDEVLPFVRCAECGHIFEANRLPDICPECYAVGAELVSPTNIILESFEIER